jgi:hypothetical protein
MTSPTAPGVTHKWPNIEAYAEEVSVARAGLAKLLEACSIFAFVG